MAVPLLSDFSTDALAWAVPIHLCSFPDTPTPVGDPIPCSFTNEDGQTFNGVVTSSPAGVFCTGLVAPTPDDPTEAADVAALYSELGVARELVASSGVWDVPTAFAEMGTAFKRAVESPNPFDRKREG